MGNKSEILYENLEETEKNTLNFTIENKTTYVEGILTDNDGRSIDNASIVVRNNENNILGVTKTNLEGNYKLEIRKSEYYNIEISKKGFPTQKLLLTKEELEQNPNFSLKKAKQKQEKIGVNGHVYEKSSRLPIENALILVYDNDDNFIKTLKTDSDGGFFISQEDRIKVRININKSGFISKEEEVLFDKRKRKSLTLTSYLRKK